MPKQYEAMRDKFKAEGLSLKEAKAKAIEAKNTPEVEEVVAEETATEEAVEETTSEEGATEETSAE